MNVELKKRCEKTFSHTEVDRAAKEFDLHPVVAELLFSRGIESTEQIKRFLNGNKDDLCDPFLMKGMKEAIERLHSAIKNRETVVVYGDYDADGVCSVAILSLMLKSKGLDVVAHIPSRTDEGYGLNNATIERLAAEHSPSIILTCDCGISGINEVEYAKSIGIECIVTDHHEVGESIPNCIVINPKQSDCNYPDKNLCGAGVAFKLTQGLCGDDSFLDFVDIAAIATVADLMPLQGENRLIVQLGLKKLRSDNCNIGLKAMVNTFCGAYPLTSSDIAYKIAPRINAAGRIGDAYRALDLLCSRDKSEITNIITVLEEDNNKRKELCDKIYCEAVQMIAETRLGDDRAIVLSNPSWSKGVTGIAAARLTNEFNRPTFILVDSGDGIVLKGTSRSINGVNVYELLKNSADLLLEYGGHSGAAGFSILLENVEAFRNRLNGLLSELDDTLFLPTAEYDVEIECAEITNQFVKQLQLLEPTGNSNTKPLFKIRATELKYAPCKNINHTSVMLGKLQMYAFNHLYKNCYFDGANEKNLIIEINESYNGGFNAHIRAVQFDALCLNDDLTLASYLTALELLVDNPSSIAANNPSSIVAAVPSPKSAKNLKDGSGNIKHYDKSELPEIIPKSIFGTLFICGSAKTYRDFLQNYPNAKIIFSDYNYLTSKNNYSGILVSPQFTDELKINNYKRIVFLDSPLSENMVQYIEGQGNAEVLLPKANNLSEMLSTLKTDKDIFSKYYFAIKSISGGVPDSPVSHYSVVSEKCDICASQFVFCLSVFKELGFFEISGGNLIINNGIKKPLTDSKIYNYISNIINQN